MPRVVTVGIDVAVLALVRGDGRGPSTGSSRPSRCTRTRRPESADLDADLAAIAELARLPQVRAIGETGLDYYRTDEPGPPAAGGVLPAAHRARQGGRQGAGHPRPRRARRRPAGARRRRALPSASSCTAFPADRSSPASACARGFVLSFAGNVTFKNAGQLREALAVTPLDQLLVETDAPFLTPVPLPRPAQRAEPDPADAAGDGGAERGRRGGPRRARSARRRPGSSATGDPARRRRIRGRSPRRLGVAPVKSRGQNFLVDPNTVRRIVRLADLGSALPRAGDRPRPRLADAWACSTPACG